jgi:rhodanese-related sulfurtransferase/glyoxylase-like metal-dependent hydrolase (beta-lactamase superfamily II)
VPTREANKEREMIFTQYYLACLSHASYLIGDETTGAAVVVDPQRDVSGYLRDADAHGLTVGRVIETHVHADFLSGHLELAARSGSVICYGRGADIGFPIESLDDGQTVSLGDVRLEILATPGHTPESVSIAVYEHAHDQVPYGVLTGDALFIGDVGRPDLLAASGAGISADEMARQLYRSLHTKLLALPDATRVFPAHGAGSACGKNLSSETQSTIGVERAQNYALAPMTEDDFVDAVLEGQPLKPHYFEFDAHRNREARPLLTEDVPPDRLALAEVLKLQADGASLLDAREPTDFATGHLKGAINVGLQGRFAEFAGDVLAPNDRLVLVGDPMTALEVKVRLARIGFDRVLGQLDDPGRAFTERPDLVEPSSRLTIEQLAERMVDTPGLVIIDVRGPAETAAGTIAGAVEIPVPVLADLIDGLDRDRPTVTYCAGGYRSSISASVLRAAGFVDVSDLVGGFQAWRDADLPVGRPRTGFGADDRNPDVPFRDASQVDPLAARRLIEAGAVLLDVREADEWDAGHAPDAVSIPMGQVHTRQSELPRDRRIVAVCRVGGRSSAIADALIARGFDAANLTGGMRAWTAAGLPVVNERGAAGSVI